MADLTTYTFYTDSFYGDTVSESDFPKWLSKATDELNFLTQGNITEDMILVYSTKIQKAVCEIIDILYKLDQAQTSAEKGAYEGNIKSRSSGGESISYGDTTTEYTKALADSSMRLDMEYKAIRRHLSDTGLLYMGM